MNILHMVKNANDAIPDKVKIDAYCNIGLSIAIGLGAFVIFERETLLRYRLIK